MNLTSQKLEIQFAKHGTITHYICEFHLKGISQFVVTWGVGVTEGGQTFKTKNRFSHPEIVS